MWEFEKSQYVLLLTFEFLMKANPAPNVESTFFFVLRVLLALKVQYKIFPLSRMLYF